MIDRNKIAGSLYGVALGDAMGRPTEFRDLKKIWSAFGRSGRMSLPRPALFTDDTQMTLAVARAIHEAHFLGPHEMSRTLRHQFIEWPIIDDRRAPGATCLQAISNLSGSHYASWTDCTIAKSKGCGANMRVAPVAFIADVDTALGLAQMQAAMTHGHPTAIAATELTALAIRLVADGALVDASLVDALIDHVNDRLASNKGGYRLRWLGDLHHRWNGSASAGMKFGWRECVNALYRLRDLLESGDQPADVCRVIGEGWIAEDALVVALYFAIMYSHDPALAISEAARTNGDSDSIASIAGSIIGASVGENGWPLEWCNRIERRDDIECAINSVHIVS
jgi:ADP-ribosylglycohydrolase